MKSTFRMLLATITFSAGLALLFAVLASPGRVAAQHNQGANLKHHHYKLIDIGTFGGPSSYFNSLFAPPGSNPGRVINKHGIFVGWADTSTPDPFPSFCFTDCFVSHAFEWQEGAATDLGTLAPGWGSVAAWINDTGQIVGLSQNGIIDPLIGFPEVRAVVWQNGQIIDLGTLGGNESFASAINNQGQIAGFALNTIPDRFSIVDLLFYGSSNGTRTRAVLWDKDGAMQDLGTLGTGHDALALFVNEHGQVAGWSYTNYIPNVTTGLPTFHPFLWEKGKGMLDLGTLGGTVAQAVNGLNQEGQVVGSTTLAGDVTHHPFLWDGEKLVDLGTLGGDNGEADWINDAAEVVGIAQYTVSCPNGGGGAHGFLWRRGVMTDLGTTDGISNSEAVYINSKTQIVGYSFTCDFSVVDAFLWENGSIVNLNALISPHSAFHLDAALFIDDRSQIAASGRLANGDTHALLLLPCDQNHPGLEGCDYSMVEAPLTMPQQSPAVRESSAPALSPSLLHRMSRNYFPGRAFGPND